MIIETEHPWQSGPTELINHALDHLHKGTDFDHRIAFLLLDLGVETLFKTFLMLPDRVTGTEVGFQDRKKAAEGNFHQVVCGVQTAAGECLEQIDLGYVEYFHGIRNTLYHQGDGISVPPEKTQGYAELAVDLLNALIHVDLTSTLLQPQLEKEFIEQVEQARIALAQLRDVAAYIIGEFEPSLLKPSLIEGIYGISQMLGKQPEDFAEMLHDYVGNLDGYSYIAGAVDHFYEWQETGQPSDYLPPDLTDPTTLYLRYIQSFVDSCDEAKGNKLFDILMDYWPLRDAISDLSIGNSAEIPSLIERCHRIISQLEYYRETLPKWLNKQMDNDQQTESDRVGD